MRHGKRNRKRLRLKRRAKMLLERRRERRRFLRAHPGPAGRRAWAAFVASRYMLTVEHGPAYVQGR